MRYLKYFTIILLLNMLLGCVTTKLDDTQKSSIKRIGLVVMVNDFYSVDFVSDAVSDSVHYELSDNAQAYVNTIKASAENYLVSKGYKVSILNIGNELRPEYKLGLSKKLESSLTQSAAASKIDTIVMLHDGHCYVAGPKDKSGKTDGLNTSGHGLVRKAAMPAQQYACLMLDIIKVKGFDKMVNKKLAAYSSFDDRDIIEKISEKKGIYTFSEDEDKGLKHSISLYYRALTRAILGRAKL